MATDCLRADGRTSRRWRLAASGQAAPEAARACCLCRKWISGQDGHLLDALSIDVDQLGRGPRGRTPSAARLIYPVRWLDERRRRAADGGA